MKIAGRIVVAPANGSDTRQETEPIHEQDKNENRGKEPKRLLHQLATDDRLEKIVKALDHPFPKILDPARDRLNAPGGNLRENNNGGGHDPRDQHRIRHRELTDLN